MTKLGAIDREPPVPRGRIRAWEVEHDGYVFQVVEMRVYDSAMRALVAASVVAGLLFVALVGLLVWIGGK